MASGIATKVTPAGKVKRVTQTTGFAVRVDEELGARFRNCVVLEAKIHGIDTNEARTFRALMRQYCDRIEAIASSPEARQAAQVLRRKVK